MGWWSTDEEGHSFAGDGTLLNGDSVADILENTFDSIDQEYERAFGRKPSRAEINAAVWFVANTRYEQ